MISFQKGKKLIILRSENFEEFIDFSTVDQRNANELLRKVWGIGWLRVANKRQLRRQFLWRDEWSNNFINKNKRKISQAC